MQPPSEERVANGSGVMFDAIAERYDVLNRALSLGVDQRWRRDAVRALTLEHSPSARVLDLATGTADLAIRIARTYPNSTVVGTDPSAGMLDRGRRKIDELGLRPRIDLRAGEATTIDAPDATFHGVTIAFGIRNVPDRIGALREMKRVTRAGGKVVVLELSEPDGGFFGPLARFHVHTIVPAVGAALSGAKEYRYLQRSIENFPPAKDFALEIEDAGLEVLRVRPLTFGVAHLYVATPRR